MEKSQFNKYINEMREMSKRATPVLSTEVEKKPAKQTDEPTRTDTTEQLTGRGFLFIHATSVEGLFPIENAKVTVFKNRLEDMEPIATAKTDQSGKSEVVALAAPPRSATDLPNSDIRPYVLYNILTEADGFLPTVNYNVAVFDSVTSIQNVNMVPKTAFSKEEVTVYDEIGKYDL